jgi:hypothetical protein
MAEGGRQNIYECISIFYSDRNMTTETRNKLRRSYINICQWENSHNVDYISTLDQKKNYNVNLRSIRNQEKICLQVHQSTGS